MNEFPPIKGTQRLTETEQQANYEAAQHCEQPGDEPRTDDQLPSATYELSTSQVGTAGTAGTIMFAGITLGTYDGGWDECGDLVREYNWVTFSKINPILRAVHVEIEPEFCRITIDYETGRVDVYDKRLGLDADCQRSFYVSSLSLDETENLDQQE